MSSAVKAKAQQADQMIRDFAAAQQSAEAQAGNEDWRVAEAPAEQQDGDDVVEAAADNESAQDDGDDRIANLEREVDKANQRWRTLQGQLNSKDQQIETLHRLLANMETGAQAAPEASEPQPQNQAVGYTKEDTDAFGEDMIDLIVRVSRQESLNAVSDLKRTMEGLSGKVDSVERTSSKVVAASFESELDAAAPEWRDLNEDPGFIEWLKGSEARLNLFSTGVNNRDASSVADIFNMYTQLHGGSRRDRKQRVSQQVSPGRGRASGAPTAQSQPDTKTWTRSEISLVYQRRQRGEIPADEFAKLEKQISKAMSEQRVDYTR
jgi:hypothetical protein